MASKTESVRSRIVKTYDLDEIEKLIKDAKVAHCMLTDPPTVVDEESVMNRLSAITLRGSDGSSCSCCGVGPFTSRAQQTAHYKHHWHTHNLKRKLFGRKPISIREFESRQDDSSNVSASDSEGDDSNKPATELFAAATRHCKAFYSNPKGQVFCIYRCLLHHRKEVLSLDGGGKVWESRVKDLLSPGFGRWAVLMVSGGHFAGCIFTGGSDAIHKTLHSYTTRRGQGMAQSTRDQTGNAPKSAGASLRRYNQDQFLMHVQNILIGWNDDLKGCSLIFYRAVGSVNQAAIFGKSSPLKKEDPRVRQLPFPTRKPSFKEVKRVFQTLASIEVYDSLEQFQKALLSVTSGKLLSKTNSDVSIAERSKKAQKAAPKTFDRAKSRERVPRELPTQVTSSEDEGPCYIDSETPADWIKTLSEQSSNGVITSSRKGLLNDCAIASGVDTDSEKEATQKKEELKKKKKNNKKVEETPVVKKGEEKLVVKKGEEKPVVKKTDEKPAIKKGLPKIPNIVKKMWRVITDKDNINLEPILEGWEGDIEAACNTQDPVDGNTALHKAAIAAKPEIVTLILSAGGDPCIKNHQLQTPYAASPHHDTRIAFRMFQAQYPDKYNYSKSQIPGPVTAEQLEQEKERKAQQKKAKRQREKEKQIDKQRANKFLQLTDEQKKKVPEQEQRCFLCGAHLPKAPFEYDSCKFCQITCLHSHRKIRPLKMSVE